LARPPNVRRLVGRRAVGKICEVGSPTTGVRSYHVIMRMRRGRAKKLSRGERGLNPWAKQRFKQRPTDITKDLRWSRGCSLHGGRVGLGSLTRPSIRINKTMPGVIWHRTFGQGTRAKEKYANLRCSRNEEGKALFYAPNLGQAHTEVNALS